MLREIFQAAVGDELVQANPVVGVKRPKLPRRGWRILTPAEVPAVLGAFTDTRARLVCMTVLLTGLRRCEVRGLRWQDVNLLEGTLRVAASKTEAGERLVALPGTLVAALEAHYASTAYKADGNYVFGHPELGSALDAMWYAREFRKALAAAGITDYVRPFHDGRHAALTNMAAAGANPVALMSVAGHTSMSTTKIYLHLAGMVFRDEATALEQRLLGTAPAPVRVDGWVEEAAEAQ